MRASIACNANFPPGNAIGAILSANLSSIRKGGLAEVFMRGSHLFSAFIVAASLVCGLAAPAQTPYPGTGSETANPTAQEPANSSPPAAAPTPQAAPAGAQPDTSAPPQSVPAAKPALPTYTVPAGTKVLLELRSAVDTRSAKPGEGVYLVSTFPVVVGNRVLIPSGVYVQGVVDSVKRAGRVRGRAQLDMHFTSMIFPNGTVVEIPGMVDNLPGAKDQSVRNDGEGTIEQHPDKGRHAGTVAEVGIPTGGTVGAISGAHAGHPIAGGVVGLAAGAAAAGIVSLFTRGADVSIPQGTQVEMVLQRPLILQQENLAGVGAPGAAPSYAPAPNQPRPMPKPNRRGRVLCPLGGLGCP